VSDGGDDNDDAAEGGARLSTGRDDGAAAAADGGGGPGGSGGRVGGGGGGATRRGGSGGSGGGPPLIARRRSECMSMSHIRTARMGPVCVYSLMEHEILAKHEDARVANGESETREGRREHRHAELGRRVDDNVTDHVVFRIETVDVSRYSTGLDAVREQLARETDQEESLTGPKRVLFADRRTQTLECLRDQLLGGRLDLEASLLRRLFELRRVDEPAYHVVRNVYGRGDSALWTRLRFQAPRARLAHGVAASGTHRVDGDFLAHRTLQQCLIHGSHDQKHTESDTVPCGAACLCRTYKRACYSPCARASMAAAAVVASVSMAQTDGAVAMADDAARESVEAGAIEARVKAIVNERARLAAEWGTRGAARPLGRGTFARVTLVHARATDAREPRTIALKSYHLPSPDQEDASVILEDANASFEAETRALNGLVRIACIDQQRGSTSALNLVAPRPVRWATSRAALVVGMDAAECTLRRLPDWLERRGLEPLRRRDLDALAYRLFECLAAAHSAGFVHRDLRPENILVYRRVAGGGDVVDDDDEAAVFGAVPGDAARRQPWALELRIGDWGSSTWIRPGEPATTQSNETMHNDYCTHPYRAPELFLMPYTEASAAADVWAAALVVVDLYNQFDDTVFLNPLRIDPVSTGDADAPFYSIAVLRAIVACIGLPHRAVAPELRARAEAYLRRDPVVLAPPPSPAASSSPTTPTAPRVWQRDGGVRLPHGMDALDETEAPLPIAVDTLDAVTTHVRPQTHVIDAYLDVHRAARTAHAEAARLRDAGHATAYDRTAAESAEVPYGVRCMLYDILQWDPARRPSAARIVTQPAYWPRPAASLLRHAIRPRARDGAKAPLASAVNVFA